jgi:hypothetical protein
MRGEFLTNRISLFTHLVTEICDDAMCYWLKTLRSSRLRFGEFYMKLRKHYKLHLKFYRNYFRERRAMGIIYKNELENWGTINL